MFSYIREYNINGTVFETNVENFSRKRYCCNSKFQKNYVCLTTGVVLPYLLSETPGPLCSFPVESPATLAYLPLLCLHGCRCF